MSTIIKKTEKGVSLVILNRPDVHNAFNEDMMSDLYNTFLELDDDDDTRVVVLTGAGKSFCAGGDLNYMKGAKDKTREQNIEESLAMAKMFSTIDRLSKPVIGVVNGACFGGGVGLMACCDVVIIDQNAPVSLSEVKLGLNPSVISPFVIAKIGAAQARRFFLTGERFDGLMARHIGLAHEVYTDEQSKEKFLQYFTAECLKNGPQAMEHAKYLIEQNQTLGEDELTQFTAEEIADLRASDEAQEGMNAFFEKRSPQFNLLAKGS